MTERDVKAQARLRFGRELSDAEVARLGRRLEGAIATVERLDGWAARLRAVEPATVTGLLDRAGALDERG